MTLAEAADRIRNAGGTIELRRDGELIVSLPPSAGGAWGGSTLDAARLLYLARNTVTACLRDKTPLPDTHVLPSGARAE